jgi:glycosyltransferase involved in cell wall biosynthesis
MPSLNEEKNITQAVQNVVDGFKRLGIRGEILVINDGSTDNTGRIVVDLSASHSFIRVIHHQSPQGIGASFWDGIQNAVGDVVTMIPGDGENDAVEILRYLPLLEQVDMVVPFIYNRSVRTLRRRILSIIYREIIKISFGLSLNYMNGTVMYRRSIFKGITLQAGGFFYQTELLVKTILNGYLYAEVPCALRQRGSGESKATTFSSLVRVARAYLNLLREVYAGKTALAVLAEDSATYRRRKELEIS